MIKSLVNISLAAKALLINAAVSVLIVLLFGSLLLAHQYQKQQQTEHQLLQLSASLSNALQRRQQVMDNQVALLGHNEALMDRLLQAEMESNISTLPLPEQLLGQLKHDLFRLFDSEGAIVARYGDSADVIPAEFSNKAWRGFLPTDEGLLFVVQAPVIYAKQIMGYVSLGDKLDKQVFASLLADLESKAAVQLSLNGEALFSTDDRVDFSAAQQVKLGRDLNGSDVSFAVGVDAQALLHVDSQFVVYLALALFFAISAWWFLYRRLIGDIVIRLHRTQRQLEALHIGDVYPAPSHVADAIDLVDRSLHSMSRRLQLKAEKLQLERQTLLTITDAAPIWIWKTDASGRLTFINRKMGQMLHLNDTDGCCLHEVLQLEAGGQSSTVPDLNADGESICKVRVADQLHDMHLITVRQLSDHGDFVGMIGLAVDMTEFHKLEASYRQAQKMEALGTLVGGVAHNFNNMLAGMTGHIFLARKKSLDQAELLQHLNRLDGVTARAAEMVKQLLAFAHKGMDIKEYVEFNGLIREAFVMARAAIPADIYFSADWCDESMTVYANASALQQVFVNLVVNARDALEDSGPGKMISVRLQRLAVNENMRQAHSALQGDFIACLSVQDSGSGISTEHLEHIFEPFFTTKEVGKGTGLGLSMSVGTVESLGGWIEIDAEPGKGALFRVCLPLAMPTESMLENAPAGLLPGHGELILLVDDEPMLLEVGEEILQSLNYRVLIASDGAEALRVFSQHATEIDLVMTDVVMPVMGGIELCTSIRQMYETMPFVFVSGYDKGSLSYPAMDPDCTGVLGKPYDIEEVSCLLSDLLSSKLGEAGKLV